MKRKVFTIVAASLGFVALVACAEVPMASTNDDAVAKQFGAPAVGEGALYIYRYGAAGAFDAFTVTVGRRTLGQLAANTYFRIELPPGRHDVRCLGSENGDSVLVDLASGETKFVSLRTRPGIKCAVGVVSDQDGRGGVVGGKRAREIQ